MSLLMDCKCCGDLLEIVVEEGTALVPYHRVILCDSDIVGCPKDHMQLFTAFIW